MPYAMPSPSSPEDQALDLPPLKLKPKHRRTRSAVPSFTDERGPGAFSSLSHLPRRKSAADKKTLFHFNNDSDSSDDPPPPKMNSLGLTVDTVNIPSNAPLKYSQSAPESLQPSSLPFPSKLSPASSPALRSPTSADSTSPFPQTPSTPVILLSNGKPLKPSLKSSHSSPNIPGLHFHTRAQSEPTTPLSAPVKNVHFAEKEALQSVRVFDKSGKPASVSKTGPLADETETETDYESSNAASTSNSYPFPVLPSPSSSPDLAVELHPALSSPVPTPNPSEYANVHLETLVLPRTRPPMLRGTIIVRNIAFAKEVAVRFTLDDWQTTSEVTCKHTNSLPSLPPPFREPSTIGDLAASQKAPDAWDRFSFVIRLEDFERKLVERTLYLVSRYTVPGSGEWWDNNNGQNYRVSFQKAKEVRVSGASSGNAAMHSQQRTFSAPATLKGTPTTAASFAQVQGRTQESAESASNALPKLALPTPRAHFSASLARPPPIVRSNSSPQPMASKPPTPFPTGSTRASLPTKLNLLNYAAPTARISPPRIPSQHSPPASADLPKETGPALPAMLDGMPATSFTWSAPPRPSPSPPPSYFSQMHSAAPSTYGTDMDTPRPKGTAPPSIASDQSYAAFVKQWCFVQSPTPSPTLTATTPRAEQPQENAWLGMESLYGVHGHQSFTSIRSDSPMMAST